MSKLLISGGANYMSQTLQYGTESIPYRVYLTHEAPGDRRKIKIDVLPNGTVHVLAPEKADLKQIKAAVGKRGHWVYNHLNKIRAQYTHVLTREYISGESHYYLGRRYVLKIITVKNIEPHVKLIRGQLQIRTRTRQPEIIKSLLTSWYRKHAQNIFERRIKALVAEIRWLKSSPDWKMRIMKKQWGSCSPKGILSLNPLLVKAPGECIDYVIIHEICHLKEHNHSQKYYRLLTQLSPNWKITKARLDSMSEYLLVD